MSSVREDLEIIHDNYYYNLFREYKSFIVNIKLYELNNSMGDLFSGVSTAEETFIDFGNSDLNLSFKEFFELLSDRNSEDSLYNISSENTLKNLVSILEDYLKEVLTYLFNRFPERVFGNKPQISLSKLLEYDNLEDLKAKVIDDKVISISYSSLKDTIKYIEKEFKVDFKFDEIIFDGLVEIGCIRNILVHNRGIINDIFLEKVEDKEQQMAEEKYEKGSKIVISPEGINELIDILDTLGKRIKDCLIHKFGKNSSHEE